MNEHDFSNQKLYLMKFPTSDNKLTYEGRCENPWKSRPFLQTKRIFNRKRLRVESSCLKKRTKTSTSSYLQHLICQDHEKLTIHNGRMCPGKFMGSRTTLFISTS